MSATLVAGITAALAATGVASSTGGNYSCAMDSSTPPTGDLFDAILRGEVDPVDCEPDL